MSGCPLIRVSPFPTNRRLHDLYLSLLALRQTEVWCIKLANKVEAVFGSEAQLVRDMRDRAAYLSGIIRKIDPDIGKAE